MTSTHVKPERRPGQLHPVVGCFTQNVPVAGAWVKFSVFHGPLPTSVSWIALLSLFLISL
jgi:hypothetical protein